MEDVERQLSAERRNWVFEAPGSVQATLICPREEDLRGTHFVASTLREVLDQVEAFDKDHGRLLSP